MCVHSNAKGEIVFATDFREGAQEALGFVKWAAKVRQSAVRVIHVLELNEGRTSFATDQAAAERSLRQIGHELRLAGVQETATLITAGHAAQAIGEAAERYEAKLLVVGLRNGRGAANHGLGRTTREILSRAGCAVCTVGAAVKTGARGAGRTLMATDLDGESLRRSLESWPGRPQQRRVRAVLPPARAMSAETVAERRRLFAKMRQMENGGAPRAVLEEAAEWKADLVVLSMAAGGYLDSFAAKSFAATIVSEAPCPVMVVRGRSTGKP